MSQTVTIDQAVTLALEHHRVGRLAEAEQIYRRVLQAVPEHPVAMHYLGLIAHQLNRHDDAIRLMARSVELLPSGPYFNNLGATYRAAGKFDLASEALRKAIELNPDAHEQHNNLGLLFLDQGSLPDARAEFQAAMTLQPSAPETLNNMATLQLKCGELEAAERSLRRSLELAPQFAAAFINLTNVLSAMRRFDEAAASADAALRLTPNDPQAHLVLAQVRLIQGDFARGWPEYEWRLRRFPELAKTFPQPRWTGQPADGKTILVYGEQGFGDAIQFIRYARPIADRGGKVIVACAPETAELMASADGVASTFRYGDSIPPFDFHCPLPSVPGVMGTTLDSLPRDVPYLRADPGRIETWRRRVADDGAKLRVGLTWAGNPLHEKDRERSCSLSDLAPLKDVPGVVFYSLQKGESAGEAANAPNGIRLIDVAADLNDFSDSAALMTNLDLVVTVDTAAAHLAGALGRPVWTMLHHNGEWRWLLDRTDTPWYPTMRLFRQHTWGEWGSVAEEMADALRTQVTS